MQSQVGTKKRWYEIERKAAFVETGEWHPVATGRTPSLPASGPAKKSS